MENTKDRKRIMNRWGILLFGVVCSMLLLLSGCGKEVTVPEYNDDPEPENQVSMMAIVSNVDEVNGKITLRPLNRPSEIVLQYNGGADVRDAYGSVFSIKQMETGSVADVVYDDNRDKLLSLFVCGADKVKRLEHVSGAMVNILENTISFNNASYQMSDGVVAISQNRTISLTDIVPQDEISVWLYNDVVCSVNVELGHGCLKLEDYAGYLGGYLEIGDDIFETVTENMELIIREGEYTLRIMKDDDVGTKKIRIIRNQDVTVSLADLAIEPKQKGFVMFKVNPSGANVYIDGKRVNTEGAVELVYGKHTIIIEADGYERYRADFNVNYAYKIKEYNLNPEEETTTQKTTQNETSRKETTREHTSEQRTTQEDTNSSRNTTEGKSTSNLVIISAPIGASVYVDHEYVGIAPISFTKVTGSHIIILNQTGCLSKSYTEEFMDDGKDITLSYDPLKTISSLVE